MAEIRYIDEHEIFEITDLIAKSMALLGKMPIETISAWCQKERPELYDILKAKGLLDGDSDPMGFEAIQAISTKKAIQAVLDKGREVHRKVERGEIKFDKNVEDLVEDIQKKKQPGSRYNFLDDL